MVLSAIATCDQEDVDVLLGFHGWQHTTWSTFPKWFDDCDWDRQVRWEFHFRGGPRYPRDILTVRILEWFCTYKRASTLWQYITITITIAQLTLTSSNAGEIQFLHTRHHLCRGNGLEQEYFNSNCCPLSSESSYIGRSDPLQLQINGILFYTLTFLHGHTDIIQKNFLTQVWVL
jgi:hypothetical protein